MAGVGLPRCVLRSARSALCLALFLGCAQEAPDTGAEIRVVNGEGAPAPQYLLFDWKDGERTLVANRRVPDKGFLDPTASPLAVVRIASEATGEVQRNITVRGMVEEVRVSEGTASVQLSRGSWQTATVELAATSVPDPDAGAPPDGGEADADPGDAEPPSTPDAAGDPPPDPPDAAAPDLPADTQPTAPDLGRDLAPDLSPPAPVTIAASADSYTEQGQSTSGMNFGKATTLEVKTQAGADNNRIAYLRFPLTAVNGPVVNATLRLYGKSSTANTTESAYAVLDDAWTELGINWNNKPALGARQSAVTVTTTAQYREWNVTAIVKSQQAAGRMTVNLAVGMDTDTNAAPDVHNSREAAANQPQLVVTR